MVAKTVQVGELNLGEIPRLWRKLDYLMTKAGEVTESQQPGLTRFSIDSTRPGGHRLYAAVVRALSAAHDCDRGLRALLQHHGATQTAMWALLRTQFEASFWALWLLDPEGTRERVLRGIHHEWLDDRASMRFYREFADDVTFLFTTRDRAQVRAQVARDHATTYRAEAEANGADWDKPPPINVTKELTLLGHAQEPGWGSMLRGVWRSLAGLQHGSAGALLRVSDQTELGSMPGGLRMQLSPNDEALLGLATTTLNLNMVALTRYFECHQPIHSTAAVDLLAVSEQRAFWRSL